MDNLEVYTGLLFYKNIEFFYMFNGEELRLVPSSEKRDEVRYNILLKRLGDGPAYTMASPVMEEPYLIGKCNETGRTMIFLMQRGRKMGSYNDVLVAKVLAYIVCKIDSHPISKIAFTCPELDYIHPVTQGVSSVIDQEQFYSRGIMSVQTMDYDTTTTELKSFQVDGHKVSVRFGISRTFNLNIGHSPITLCSTMSFLFEPTEDYAFIFKLWCVAKEFLQFLCHRKNVYIPIVDLSTPTNDDNTRLFATLKIIGEHGESEIETLRDRRYIKLAYLDGTEGRILDDIASRRLYTRHIPDTYASSLIINAARFVMITAAFEWEFKRLYPDGIKKSSKTLEIEAKATDEIQKLINNSSGELKHKYKFLKRLISTNSLQAELIHTGMELGEIVDIFGKVLYSLNDTELIYAEMGKRLSEQRNNFAHGNLDIDFIENAALDLVYAERIVYAMQLKYYGVNNKSIQRAINDLFHCSIMIQ